MNGAKVPKIRTNSAFLWTLNPLNQFEPPCEPPCCNRIIVSRVSLQGNKNGCFRKKSAVFPIFYIILVSTARGLTTYYFFTFTRKLQTFFL